MPIGNAVQRGSFVYIYDEKGRQLRSLASGSGPNDGLVGYTGGTVSIRRGSFDLAYDTVIIGCAAREAHPIFSLMQLAKNGLEEQIKVFDIVTAVDEYPQIT